LHGHGSVWKRKMVLRNGNSQPWQPSSCICRLASFYMQYNSSIFWIGFPPFSSLKYIWYFVSYHNYLTFCSLHYFWPHYSALFDIELLVAFPYHTKNDKGSHVCYFIQPKTAWFLLLQKKKSNKISVAGEVAYCHL